VARAVMHALHSRVVRRRGSPTVRIACKNSQEQEIDDPREDSDADNEAGDAASR